MSNSNSPAASTSDAATFLIPGSILLGIAILTSVARFYFRYRPEWLLRWDDYVLAFSLVSRNKYDPSSIFNFWSTTQLFTVAWFALIIVLYLYGRVIVDPKKASIMGPLMIACSIFWTWALNMIRVSMCLLILRLRDSRRWKWSLWSMIAAHIAMIISATSLNLAYCRPISAVWEANPDAVCLKPWQMRVYGYTYHSK